jgi:Raf kinase inhibitor-like YbhB/YbcL family protein
MVRMAVLAAALAAVAPGALAQQGDGTSVTTQVSVVKPALVEATPERIATLRVPDGFEVGVFAEGLGNPRILVVSPQGHVYASRREQGDVVMLADADGDGRADGSPRVVATLPQAHGLAIHDGRLYIATVRELYAAPIAADGSLGTPERLIDDLPDGGQHPNRTLVPGPDGHLYLSIGSTCNACNETNPEHAALLRVSPDGRQRSIFASGLRNTIGFAFHPSDGRLWGMDHGIDDLGDDVQHEELNLLAKGNRYGWPHVYDDGALHPQTTPPGGITKEQWRAMSTPMVAGYTAHAAPMQMVFHPGNGFPRGYAGDGFVAMRGSWNRGTPSGYEVVRVRMRNGQPQGFESFLTGFLVDGGRGHFARPVGLAVMPDGALLVGDDANGVVYRVAMRGQAGTRAATRATRPVPARELARQVAEGHGVPLAMERRETAGRARATSTLTAPFADGAPIEPRHSEYGEGLSPPLRWTPVEGAVSWLLVVEDPDAKQPKPFVHWVAWNIPGNVTSLPEGLPRQPRLVQPEGMLQGATSAGSPGWFGPKPPVGDPPHHYHVQVFALDSMLDGVLPGATRDEVLRAARGHVIGHGHVVGTYRQAVPPTRD